MLYSWGRADHQRSSEAYGNLHNTFAPLSMLHQGDVEGAKHFLQLALEHPLARSQELQKAGRNDHTPPGLIRQAEHLLESLHKEEGAEHPAGP